MKGSSEKSERFLHLTATFRMVTAEPRNKQLMPPTIAYVPKIIYIRKKLQIQYIPFITLKTKPKIIR